MRRTRPNVVVELDRGLAKTMLDAGALDAGGELTADLLGQLGRDFVAEKGGHVIVWPSEWPDGRAVHRAVCARLASGTPDRWRTRPASSSSGRTEPRRRTPDSTAGHSDRGPDADRRARADRPRSAPAASRRCAQKRCRQA